MGQIAAPRQLGRLNEPVVFEVEEGPHPGPVAQAVQKDSPAPVDKGIDPLLVILGGAAAIGLGYIILRPLVD